MRAGKTTSAIRRWIAAVVMSSVTAGVLSVPGEAMASAGYCRFSLPITLSAPDPRHPEVRPYASTDGSASCTGNLGPWLLGDQLGWSTASGRFDIVSRPRGGAGSFLLAGGEGNLWAVAPRFAWFHPSMVTLTSSFRLHPAGDRLLVTGSGRLVPTLKSPVASSLTITGSASLTTKPSRSGSIGARPGLLTLELAVSTPR